MGFCSIQYLSGSTVVWLIKAHLYAALVLNSLLFGIEFHAQLTIDLATLQQENQRLPSSSIPITMGLKSEKNIAIQGITTLLPLKAKIKMFSKTFQNEVLVLSQEGDLLSEIFNKSWFYLLAFYCTFFFIFRPPCYICTYTYGKIGFDDSSEVPKKNPLRRLRCSIHCKTLLGPSLTSFISSSFRRLLVVVP